MVGVNKDTQVRTPYSLHDLPSLHSRIDRIDLEPVGVLEHHGNAALGSISGRFLQDIHQAVLEPAHGAARDGITARDAYLLYATELLAVPNVGLQLFQGELYLLLVSVYQGRLEDILNAAGIDGGNLQAMFLEKGFEGASVKLLGVSHHDLDPVISHP